MHGVSKKEEMVTMSKVAETLSKMKIKKLHSIKVVGDTDNSSFGKQSCGELWREKERQLARVVTSEGEQRRAVAHRSRN